MLGFGLLSLAFGFIRFRIPGVVGGASDLREIPLIISILYLPNPVYLVGTAFLTALGTDPESPIASSFIMHSIGLIGLYYLQRLFIPFRNRIVIFVGLWILGIGIYYMVLVLPLMVITNHWFGVNQHISFWQLYLSISSGIVFELIVTALISTLFVVNHNTQIRLKANLKILEQRNQQLSNYAYINSHFLRAPLARLLGLANLLRLRTDENPCPEMVDRFQGACKELDEVVRSISETLYDTSDSLTDSKQKVK